MSRSTSPSWWVSPLSVLFLLCGCVAFAQAEEPPLLNAEDFAARDFQGYVPTHGADPDEMFHLYMDIRGQLNSWSEGPAGDGLTHIGYRPTVVFESGYNGNAHEWSFHQAKLAEHTLTVSYHRAGLASSQPSPDPRTYVNQMRELRTALHNAGVPGPYLFVAHSSGGLKARVFADEYPQEVAGVAFIDASHEAQADLLMQYLTPEALAMFPAPLFVGDEDPQTLFMESAYVAQAVDDSALQDKPIAVLSSTNLNYLDLQPGTQELATQGWLGFQTQLAELSEYSTHLVDWSGQARHYLHLEKPHWVNGAIINLLYHHRAVAQGLTLPDD